MNHLLEEDLVDAYYDTHNEALHRHLAACAECSDRFEQLRQALDACSEYPVPPRTASYGAEVWARLAPRLPLAKPRPAWMRWWLLGPAFAVLLATAFLAGHFTRRAETGLSAKAQERVLLLAISDHLERSQIVLTDLDHADAGQTSAMDDQRGRARELLDENRLLRESARRAGDVADAALLEDLERVLLDVANAPANNQPARAQETLRAIQNRIENDGLLFKVRITADDAGKRGQKL
jgi:hypothetical protein